MGSIRNLHCEFPLPFLQALLSGPSDTHVMLMNTEFKDHVPCSLTGWHDDLSVFLVVGEKDNNSLSLQLTDDGGLKCCLQCAVNVESSAKLELDEEPQTEPASAKYQEENWSQVLADSATELTSVLTEEDETMDYKDDEMENDTKPDVSGTYTCPDKECLRTFDKFHKVRHHVKNSRHKFQANIKHLLCCVEDMRPYLPQKNGMRMQCPYCKRERPATDAIARHLRVWHSDESDFKQVLAKVNYQFRISRNRERNRDFYRRKKESRLQKPKQSIYAELVCPFCDKFFNNRVSWARHKNSFCPKNPSIKNLHKCPHCNYCSRSLSSLERHIPSHLKESLHQCTDCQESFSSAFGLKLHMASAHKLSTTIEVIAHSNNGQSKEEEEEMREVEEIKEEEAVVGTPEVREISLPTTQNEQTKETWFLCPAKNCDACFPDFKKLTRHIRQSCYRSSEESFQELMCKAEDMEPRVQRAGQLVQSCPFCDRVRPGKFLLKHLLVWHSHEKTYEEELARCNKQIFKAKVDLRRSRRSKGARTVVGSSVRAAEVDHSYYDAEIEEDEKDVLDGKSEGQSSSVSGRSRTEAAFICPEVTCQHPFQRFKALSQHVRLVHKKCENYHGLLCSVEDMEPYSQYGQAKVSCPLCDRVRRGKAILKHLSVWHGKDEKFDEALQKCRADLQSARNDLNKKAERCRQLLLKQKKLINPALRTKGCKKASVDKPKGSQQNLPTQMVLRKAAVDRGKQDKEAEMKSGEEKDEKDNGVDDENEMDKLAERLFLCPAAGCTNVYQTFKKFSRHLREAHKKCDNYQELLRASEDMEPNDNFGLAKVSCPLCDRVRPGKAIFKHLLIWHREDPKYDDILKECEDNLHRAQLNVRNSRLRKRRSGAGTSVAEDGSESTAVECKHPPEMKIEKQKEAVVERRFTRSSSHKLRSQEIVKDSGERSKFQCILCSEMLKDEASCLHHVKHLCLKNPDRMELHVCKKCNFESTIEDIFEKHVKTAHSADSPSGHKCKFCRSMFPDQDALLHHQHQSHKEQVKDKPLPKPLKKCKYCSLVFNHINLLRQHQYQKHQTEIRKDVGEALMCEQCGDISQTEAAYRVHLQKHSSDDHVEKVLICLMCGSEYKTRHLLRNHIFKFHDGAFPLTCSVCKNGMECESALTNHKCFASLLPLDVKCHICELVLSSQRAFLRHVDRVHGKNDPSKERRFASTKIIKLEEN